MDEYAFGSSPGGDIEKYRALVHTSRGVRPRVTFPCATAYLPLRTSG
nr:hypothetical protein [Streptomyces sp. alain-838]